MLDQAEVRVGSGETTYSWDGEARFGGDIDKLVIKNEGEGAFGGAFDRGEGQLLWGHAIGPYFDLQTGLRQDVGPGPSPTYAVVGVEGLAPIGSTSKRRCSCRTRAMSPPVSKGATTSASPSA